MKPSGDAVAGIVTERGRLLLMKPKHLICQYLSFHLQLAKSLFSYTMTSTALCLKNTCGLVLLRGAVLHCLIDQVASTINKVSFYRSPLFVQKCHEQRVFLLNKLLLDKSLLYTPSPEEAISDSVLFTADYLTKVAVRNKSSKDMKVQEIMTERSQLMTIDPGHSTMDAMSMMIKFNFRHVPVVSFCSLHLFPSHYFAEDLKMEQWVDRHANAQHLISPLAG